jgi:hypothetical protein
MDLAQLALITNRKVNDRWKGDPIGVCMSARSQHYSATDYQQQYELPR